MKNLLAFMLLVFTVFFIACDKDNSLQSDTTTTVVAENVMDSSIDGERAPLPPNSASTRCGLFSKCQVTCEGGSRPYATCSFGKARCGCNRGTGDNSDSDDVGLHLSYGETMDLIGELGIYLNENGFSNAGELVDLYSQTAEYLNVGDAPSYYAIADEIDAVIASHSVPEIQLLVDWFGE